MIVEAIVPHLRPYASVRPTADAGFSEAIGDGPSTLSASLHRPYLDLGPLSAGPLHSQSIPFAFDQFVHRSAPPQPLQVHPSPALRQTVAGEARLYRYQISRAEDLPPALRTPAWRLMVEHVDRFPALDADAQIRLVHLLEALALYTDIETVLKAGGAHCALTAKQTFAALKLRPSASARLADAVVLRELVETADPRLGIAAATSLIVLSARARPPLLAEAERGRNAGLRHLRRLEPHHLWQDAIAASAFWRAASYVPYLRGEAANTACELDEAERLARSFRSEGDAQRLLLDQNLHPLLETRLRVASDFGESARAVLWAQELAALDPLDGKVHIRLGDAHFAEGDIEAALTAYRAAIKLGAPFSALGAFHAGACLDRLGRAQAAADAFHAALRDEPAALSAAMALEAAARATDDRERLLLAQSSRRWMQRCLARGPPSPSPQSHETPRPKGGARPPAMQTVRAAGRRMALCPPDVSAAGSPAGHLLRAYLDLGGEGGPQHARGTRALAAHLAADEPLPVLQRHTATWLRPALTREVGIPAYDVADPRALPPALRGALWSHLCDTIDRWDGLSGTRQARTAFVLNRLGFYALCVRLTQRDSQPGPSALARAVALFKTGRRAEAERLIASLARHPGLDPKLRAASVLTMVVHHGKITHELDALSHWVETMERHVFPAGTAGPDLVDASAILRARSFLPFHQRRLAETMALLDEAEGFGLEALRQLGDDDVSARENMFALLETRLAAAEGFGDRQGAVALAERLAAFDPADARSHVLLGQARLKAESPGAAAADFLAAARLGAPFEAEAWHGHAICHVHLGDVAGAISSLRRATRADPWAITSLIALRRILLGRPFASHVEDLLLRWCVDRLSALRAGLRHRQSFAPEDHFPEEQSSLVSLARAASK